MPQALDAYRVDHQTRTVGLTTLIGATFSLADDSAYNFRIRIVAHATDGTSAMWYYDLLAKRVGDLAPVILGPTAALVSFLELAGWLATLSVVGDVLQVDVTGSLGKTIDWFIHADINGFIA